jgi:ribosome-associated protein
MSGPEEQADELAPMGGVEIGPGVHVPAGVLRFAFSRSSGPGGQNVNKRSTKAELRAEMMQLRPHMRSDAWERLCQQARGMITDEGELLIVCDEHRSQGRNRDECLTRLRTLVIAAQAVPKVRRKTKPSRGSKERRLEAKRVRSQVKARRRSAGE